jgi:hypothetical protein
MRRARLALLCLCLAWAPAAHTAVGGYCPHVDVSPSRVAGFRNCVGSIAPQLVAALLRYNRAIALRGGWDSEADYDEDVLEQDDSRGKQQVTPHLSLRPLLPPRPPPSEAPCSAAAAQSVARVARARLACVVDCTGVDG